MNKTVFQWVVAVVFLGLSGQIFGQENANQDCSLAERYYDLAQASLEEFDEDKAAGWLEQAAAECPRFAYYQDFGQIKMQSLEASDKQAAVEAFVKAHEIAVNDEERAAALYMYASLLDQEGDPQNANAIIREARRLNQNDPDIAALANAIQEDIENPTSEQLVRGLADSLYRPLRLAGREAAARPSVNIPIYFEYNSTEVDAGTAENIRRVAEILEDDRFDGKRFTFVGHADTRGDGDYNMRLSRERADAIYDEIVDFDPDLEGRITVIGRGAQEPIAFGTTEEDHRANRRLQIIVEE